MDADVWEKRVGAMEELFIIGKRSERSGYSHPVFRFTLEVP